LVRFGLKWRLWDKVQEMGLGWSLPALSPGSSNSICQNWLLGGEGDKQFLVEPAGLIIPCVFNLTKAKSSALKRVGRVR